MPPIDTLPTATLALDNTYEPFKYAFMFPTMTMVAVLCQSAGIGGAALLSPIFLLVFPILGDYFWSSSSYYMLPSASSAIASALLTECFGFASGLSGFWRRGLIDWATVQRTVLYSIPASLLGALIAPSLAAETQALRLLYAILMIAGSLYLALDEKPAAVPDDCPIPDDTAADDEFRSLTSADGTVYTYLNPLVQLYGSSKSDNEDDSTKKPLLSKTTVATVSGALITGLLGVGMGEVLLPQFVRLACMPLPVAAGTSVAVVVMTALTAALVQFLGLANELMAASASATTAGLSLTEALLQVIPWSLVQYTIPGAILGGQIAPWLAANRILNDDKVEDAVTILFAVIGVAFLLKFLFG